MLWLPPVKAAVVNEAVVPVMLLVPRMVEPSLNVIVPVAPLMTVAQNVTEVLKVEGLSELDTLVELLAWLTVWVSVDEVLPKKLESPL